MAFEGSKGKMTDMSTEWSEYEWDERGFWISFRLNASGDREYRYPEQTQSSSQDPQAIPRSLIPNSIAETSSPGIIYGAYGSEQVAFNRTYDDAGTGYSGDAGYQTSYAQDSFQIKHESSSADRDSVPTFQSPSYVAATAYYTTGTTYNSTDHVADSLASMAITGNSTGREQAASTSLPREGKRIRNPAPNSSSSEKLDPRYKIVSEKMQRKFWRVGRVFMVLWTEPARSSGHDQQGGPSTAGSNIKFSKTYLEGTAFSEIRRFVVVSEGHGNSICSPIHTYGGQATLKPNLPDRLQHAIIYSCDRQPPELSYETEDGRTVREDLNKDAIKVRREQTGPEGDLGSLSRINYSKIYTVENYVRVLNIGMVEKEWIPTLIHNSFVKPRESPIEGPRIHSRRSDPRQDDSKSRGKEKDKRSGKKRR